MTTERSIRVLVIDDEYPIRVSLGGYLEDRGFDVYSAESAEETIDLLARQTMDFIIVDLRLPGIDGNALILKAREIQPALKFVIHTGSTDYQVPPELKELGISEEYVFRKPLANMQVIVDAIKKLTGK